MAAGVLGVLGLAASVALAGCGSSQGGGSGAASTGKLRVVATTTQAGDFSRSIGGGLVTVTQLIKPNVDPHDFEPSPADLDALAKADVLVTNGAGLESWLDDAVSASGFEGTRVVMADGVPLRAGSGSETGQHDPHIWHDPRNAKIMVTDIEKGFAIADPAHAPAFEKSLATYLVALDALDRRDAAEIATIPASQRLLVTNHDAFGYYTARYGITYVGSIMPSFDTSAELSGKTIQDIVAKIRKTGVKAVFSESSLPPKTAESIGREAGVTVIAGEDSLYADSLGPAGSAGDTYLKAEQHNTDVIVKALR
ncbi:zinc ABC transporter substrate-binding protein [Frankia sp. AgB1.9]|nr:zinc ABC transporter substrate-binding protein [Frankia sp. AgW1.1]MBL7551706.1 zinc ABC transporter substrate-binding protein [Frankia sp. AgB1.9]MBL7618963.1 zinc ABC transporter substrate-binding protein [Frankia sp. AgB1.8]